MHELLVIKESTVNQGVLNLDQVRCIVPAGTTEIGVEWVDGTVARLPFTFDCILRHLAQMKSNHGVK
jgi:hypothetical protein